jgi:hypothetical protein
MDKFLDNMTCEIKPTGYNNTKRSIMINDIKELSQQTKLKNE